jgi:type I restriction enzyme S subunit
MKYGLSDKQLQEIKEILASYESVEKAVLFGSRAIDTYKEASDVDIAIKGKKADWSLAMTIKDHLEEETYLPFFFDVVAYGSVESEELKEHIDGKGKVLFERGMSKWREVRLSKHIDLISGFAFKSKDFLDHQEQETLPVIKIKNVANGDVNLEKVVYHKYDDSFSRYLLSKGDVLIAMTGNHPQAQTQVVGAVSKYKLDLNALLNQRVGKIIPIGSTCLDFVYYFFKDKDTHRYLANESSGSANQANISKATIVGIETDFPEPAEQKAIAEVLSSLDDKIDLLHRQNKTLEQMAETLFRQWFVEEAGEDWGEGVLDDILTVKGGTTPSTKNADFWNGDIHWTTPKDLSINSPLFLMDTLRMISNAGLEKISSGLLPKGTLLLSSRAPVGYLAIAEIPLAINQGYIAIIDNNGFSSLFIYLWLKTNMDYVKSHSNGSTFQEISKTSFKALEIVIPPKDLRLKFDEIVNDNFNKIRTNSYQIRTLQSLRDTLLPKLMSGEVRIASNG